MSAPHSFPLNGCDTFMLAMDAAMRRHGSCGNICHLLVTFPFETDLTGVTTTISNHPAFSYVSGLRLSARFLRAPRWKETAQPQAAIPFDEAIREEHDLEAFILSHKREPRSSAPFGCRALPRYVHGPSLLFFWHHALCDAHGGELLVKLLCSSPNGPTEALRPTPTPATPLRTRLQRAQRTKRLIFSKARAPISRFGHADTRSASPSYKKIRFSSEETKEIDALSKMLTGGMFPTAFYLAATTRAAAGMAAQPPSPHAFFVPVPHDIRRVTKQRSPLSNQVSFAFFRINSETSSSLVNATNNIIEQLHDTIAGEHQHGMLDFLRFIGRLPSRFYWRVIEHPTKGHPASLYFSDIGNSLSSLETVHNTPVSYATHYPPVVTPPGFTTVWSRYRGNLEVTICYDTSAVEPRAVTRFEELLRAELLGELT